MSQRRLAATVFADIAGYTAMMQKDEQHALTIQARFSALIEKQVSQFSGEVVQFYGDGCLLLFGSSTDAVLCARSLQLSFVREGIPVRIGIHTGDVVIKDGNAFGDSVNISSRIESIAEPGSVLFSGAVATHIRNKAGLRIRSIGHHRFKNVDQPLEVFALDHPELSVPDVREVDPEPSVATQGRNYRRRNFLIAVAFAILCIFAYWLWPKPISNTAGDAALADLAILPFHINAGEDLQYLSEALPDLLSAKIEGVADFQLVDPNAIFGLLRPGNVIRDPGEAKQVVEELGANKFILGSLTRLGNSLHVNASLYDNRGVRIAQQTVEIQNKEDIPVLVDELTRKLIVTNLDLQQSDILKTGAITTKNLDALRLFFEGESYRRKYQLTQAVEKYEGALRLDSTFAMALYRLVYIQNNIFGVRGDYRRIKQLRSQIDALPAKYQLLAEALLPHLGRNIKTSIEKYRQILTTYPNNVEANVMMGETLFHYNKLLGNSITEARPYLAHALKFDPANTEAMLHLAEICLIEGDTAQFRVFEEQLPPAVDTYLDYKKVVLVRDSAQFSRNAARVANDPQFVSTIFLASCHLDDYLPRAFAFLQEVRQINPPHLDAQARLMEHITRGDEEEVLHSTDKKQRVIIALLAIPSIGHPGIPAFKGSYHTMTAFLSDGEAILEELPFASKWNFHEMHCILALARGREKQFNHHMQIVRNKARSDPDFREYAQFLDHYFAGIRKFQAGDYAEAEEHFAALDELTFPLQDNQTPFFNRPMARFMRGDICLRDGRLEEALGWFENFWTEPSALLLMPWTYERRARIYEQQGRTDEAIEYYRKFIELYADSAPQYQTYVQEARERMDALIRASN